MIAIIFDVMREYLGLQKLIKNLIKNRGKKREKAICLVSEMHKYCIINESIVFSSLLQYFSSAI